MNNFVSKFVVGVLAITLLGGQAVSAKELSEEQLLKAQTCVLVGKIANDTMTYRQAGIKRLDAQKLLRQEYQEALSQIGIDIKSDDMVAKTVVTSINGLIPIAYQKPIASSIKAKEKTIQEFTEQATRECLREIAIFDE